MHIKNEKGNVLLETAIIFPIFLLVISAVVQFGFILNAKIAVNSAAYEAARAATISEDAYGAAREAAQDYAGSNLPGWNYNERLKSNIFISGTEPGKPVTVEVIYLVPVFFKNLGLPDEDKNGYTEVKGVSVMRIEEKE